MIDIIKKQGKPVQACRLGGSSPLLERLMAQGTLRALPDGSFEVFSQEAVLAGSGRGQRASSGDYIKIDGAGFPYPNSCEFFQKNHRHIEGDTYEQIPAPLKAWTAEEPLCPEVKFLIREKGLVLNEAHPKRFFSAVLWGTPESAPRDAVLVFYELSYGADGAVTDAVFNFVVQSEFRDTYRIL